MTVVSLEDCKAQALANVPAVIRDLKRIAGLTDLQIGEAIGLSRSVAQMRVTEISKWSYEELYTLAEWFGLPIDLFFMDPREATPRALLEFGFPYRFWDERGFPDQAKSSSGWMWETAGQAVKN